MSPRPDRGRRARVAKILVIEDDPQIMALQRRVIATLPGPHDILNAANVYEALELVKTGSPDLIMLDCVLGQATTGNGFMAFYHNLLRGGVVPDVPIIVVSGMPLKQLEGLKAAYASIKTVFQKPFDVMVLREELLRWLPEQPVERAALASQPA